jgi:hypothetical protein
MATIEEDNNLMWNELRQMNDVAPEANSLLGLSIVDRHSFKTEATVKYGFARGDHTPPKNLITSKNYQGPDIKPLMPKYVAE